MGDVTGGEMSDRERQDDRDRRDDPNRWDDPNRRDDPNRWGGGDWWPAGGRPGAVDPRATWARAGEDVVSFATLRAETGRLARDLRSYGIRPGSSVAVHGVPSFTQLWCVLALWSIGAQVVWLEQSLSAAERSALLALSTPQFVITLGERYEDAGVFVGECEVLVRRRPGGRPARTGHCLVQFSSGTTGRPKAVGRTRASLLAEVARLAPLPLPRAGERVAVLEPVAHSFALIGGVLHALTAGASVEFPVSGAPEALVAAAGRAQVVLGRPHHFAALAGAAPEVRLPLLRLAVSGGDALPEATAGAFARRHGVLVGQAYGTTETGLVAADLTGAYGPGCVGAPVPGVRTRIRGGVLQVWVPESPYPYDPQDAPPGGWLTTHDLAARDPATGALWLRGRDGRTASGAYLREIEEVLRAHRHVTEAVVLGPDPVEAHVTGPAELTGAELSAWCRRFLADQEVPRRFHVVPELVRSASGKVLRDRARLRERGWAPPPPAGRPGRCR
ncbi:acyl--CoA ligase [Streptomyces sp. LP05-1]|uniref:Acyl--CoA ligase n=1 Tax=Streptomyces pyxinae TaxID=2970734 RepID=A0ABT2CK67_9ACTN|nr:class I adenylate-forming enzyme family protein [Streptomyces sp. LP05-1]MCS0637811.1 acyl--CoA ligase [Streptomyces sp. LP05-1]